MDISGRRDLTGGYAGRHKLIKFLGGGASGSVYLAADEETGINYAVKHIEIRDEGESESFDYDGVTDGGAASLSRYLKRVKLATEEITNLFKLSKKDSRYIVNYYDHEIKRYDNPSRCEIFIRMEYLKPLRTAIFEKGMSLGDILSLGISVCEALILCHKNGVVHRDIKEANLFVTDEGGYKLGDFGVAKNLSGGSQVMTVAGTFEYMAPEISAREPGDHTVDIYSLGIVLYKLLRKSRTEEFPPPIHGNKRLADCLSKACAPKKDRYKNAESFKAGLEKCLDGLSREEKEARVLKPRSSKGPEGSYSGASSPSPKPSRDVPPPLPPKPKKHKSALNYRLIIVVAGALVLLAAALFVLPWFFVERDDRTAHGTAGLVTEIPLQETPPSEPAVPSTPGLTANPSDPSANALTGYSMTPEPGGGTGEEGEETGYEDIASETPPPEQSRRPDEAGSDDGRGIEPPYRTPAKTPEITESEPPPFTPPSNPAYAFTITANEFTDVADEAWVTIQRKDSSGFWLTIYSETVSRDMLPHTVYVDMALLRSEETVYVFVDGVQKYTKWIYVPDS
ncbi:MAG: serine/threonine protein kinase [Clostridiales bacterium]|jgi:serine/threonine protein kinase|nr:serine/threonine protein kinase [Clostridiales bacterium]